MLESLFIEGQIVSRHYKFIDLNVESFIGFEKFQEDNIPFQRNIQRENVPFSLMNSAFILHVDDCKLLAVGEFLLLLGLSDYIAKCM
jgi:hypothetical protein